MNHRTPAEERLAAALSREQPEDENASLRDLLAAVAACADVPIDAGATGADDRLAWKRADWIRAYLSDIDYSERHLCAVLAVKAQALREIAALPLKYEVYQPHPAQDPPAVLPRVHLHLFGQDGTDARQMLEACGLVEYRAEVAAS